jgi:hypothetical protein
LTPPEPGYRLKLRRAKQHLDTINAEVDRFNSDHLNGAIACDPEPSDGWWILRFREVPPLDPMIGVYLGDVAHQARSALDNLVCAMIRCVDPGRDLKHAAFPIFEDEQKWATKISQRRGGDLAPTDGVTPEVLAAIEASQPYKISDRTARRDASLQWLRVLSNADKHRAIPVVRAEIAPDSIAKRSVTIEPPGVYAIGSEEFAEPGTVIETGAEVARMKLRRIATTDVNEDPGTGFRTQHALNIIVGVDGGRHEFSHRRVWEMLGDVWKAVLRVESAAGISGLPLPHDDWTWKPE